MQQAVTSNETREISLFDPVRLGPLVLPNRVVMAPLTRSRASRDGVPSPLAAEYYAQRASAGASSSVNGNFSSMLSMAVSLNKSTNTMATSPTVAA